MKRILSILLAALMLTGVLTGCTSQNETPATNPNTSTPDVSTPSTTPSEPSQEPSEELDVLAFYYELEGEGYTAARPMYGADKYSVLYKITDGKAEIHVFESFDAVLAGYAEHYFGTLTVDVPAYFGAEPSIDTFENEEFGTFTVTVARNTQDGIDIIKIFAYKEE